MINVLLKFFHRAKLALNQVSASIKDILKGQPLLLQFDGLASFGSNVLFVDVNDETKASLKQIFG